MRETNYEPNRKRANAKSKLTFRDFQVWAEKEIRNWLPPGYEDAEYSIHPVDNLSNVYTALTVRKRGLEAAPSINLDRFYQGYLDGAPLDSVMKEMVRMVLQGEFYMDLEWLNDYEKVKHRLFIRLSNAEFNQSILESIPHKLVLDLAVTYHIWMEIPGRGAGNIKITNDLLEMYGIDCDQLHEDAMKNSQIILPAHMDLMPNFIFGEASAREPGCNCSEGMDEAAGCPDPDPINEMVIVTNEKLLNGASALLYPGTMEKAAEILGGDYYVLPSSVHELILFAPRGRLDVEAMTEMVRSINAEHVELKDRLSDTVYHYDPETMIFEKAADYAARCKGYAE